MPAEGSERREGQPVDEHATAPDGHEALWLDVEESDELLERVGGRREQTRALRSREEWSVTPAATGLACTGGGVPAAVRDARRRPVATHAARTRSERTSGSAVSSLGRISATTCQ